MSRPAVTLESGLPWGLGLEYCLVAMHACMYLRAIAHKGVICTYRHECTSMCTVAFAHRRLITHAHKFVHVPFTCLHFHCTLYYHNIIHTAHTPPLLSRVQSRLQCSESFVSRLGEVLRGCEYSV